MKTVGTLKFIDSIPEKTDFSYDISDILEISTADHDGDIAYKEINLNDRYVNCIKILCNLDELRLIFPSQTDGKIRDFELYIEVGNGTEALTAPSLSHDPKSGITLMNDYKEVPEIAAGTATSAGRTILYFSEISSNCFLLKGEQLEVI